MESSPYDIPENKKSEFKPEEYKELEEKFKEYDKKNDGTVSKTDLIPIMINLGFRKILKESILKILGENELKESESMNFEDFLNFIKHYNSQRTYPKFCRIPNKQKKKIFSLEENTEDPLKYSSFPEDEKIAYSKLINYYLKDDKNCSKYLPINPNSDELYKKIKDGVLLSKLINKVNEGTIDDRVIINNDNLTQDQQNSNLKLIINSLKSIGCNLRKDINYQSIIDENKKDVLEILWKILSQIEFSKINIQNYPQIIHLLNINENISVLLILNEQQILFRWFNQKLKLAGYPLQIINFNRDLIDSEKYLVLLNQLFPDKIAKPELKKDADVTINAENLIQNINKLENIYNILTKESIIKGSTKINTLFISLLFNQTFSLEVPTQEDKEKVLELFKNDSEGGREERAIKVWMNSLGLEGVYIHNIYEELKDGLLLLQIIDFISPGSVEWKNIKPSNKSEFQIMVHCNEFIEACKRAKLNIVGIGGSDIRKGDKKFMLSIYWQLLRLHNSGLLGNIKESDLINWANGKVKEENKINKFSDKSLSNSIFFIDLLDSIEPGIINWNIVCKDNFTNKEKESNAKYTLSIAKMLNVNIFLTWEDIVEVNANLIFSFVNSLYILESKMKNK